MNKLQNIHKSLYFFGVRLYENQSGYQLNDAQRNLQGRTHYVDDATLKSFKARILRTHACNNGLYFVLQESLPHPDFDYKRVRRNVVFDVFGKVINEREAFTSASKADNDYYAAIDELQSDHGVNLAYMTLSNKLNRDQEKINEALKALSDQE